MVDLSVLVLGTADWQQPIATNQHYVTRELLADRDSDVSFVESLALRRPQFTRRDMVRIFARFKAAFTSPSTSENQVRPVPDGLRVISPIVIPIHNGTVSAINRRLLRRRVSSWLERTERKVLWTYSPVTYGLEEFADMTVYHCVDLLGEFPGIDRRVISKAERSLAATGARAVATSQIVRDHLLAQGFKEVELWENVADTAVIAAADPLLSKRFPGRAVFAGNLSPKKVDFPLLERLADVGLDVVVAGPRAEGGGDVSDQFESLLSHGVTYAGMLSLEELAEELVTATVGLIPYRLNSYTRGVSPLKTYEYMAAGLPVVSTNLPGVHELDGSVFVEESHEAFVERAVYLARAFSVDEATDRLRIADRNSWAERGVHVRAKARNS